MPDGANHRLRMRANAAYPGVTVGYVRPAAALRPYISTISHTAIEPHAGAIADMIYPEWGNVRFSAGGTMMLRTGKGPLEDCTPSGGIGPTSHATRFRLTSGHYWSVGLTPLGWAALVDIRAAEMAERWTPVAAGTPFARFAPLVEDIPTADPERFVRRIEAHVATLLAECAPDDPRVPRVHAALVDPALGSVAELAAQAGMTVRTLERISASVFGFAPRLLLRRQRFLRSLELFMLDPSLSWIETLDTHYVDQAHFIRDFRRFMEMTPRQYAALPHPVMWAAAEARSEAAGTVMQVLQAPDFPGEAAPHASPLR